MYLQQSTFTAIRRLVFDQTSGHHSLAKLTHKVNHHTGAKGLLEAEEDVRGAETERHLALNPFLLKPHCRGLLCSPSGGGSDTQTSEDGFCCGLHTVWGLCFSNFH